MLDYICFEPPTNLLHNPTDHSVDLSTLASRELKISSQEKGISLQSTLYHYAGLARGRRLAANLRFIAIVLEDGPVVEVFEKVNKDNRVQIAVDWVGSVKPLDLNVEDIFILEESDLLFTVTNKGLIVAYRLSKKSEEGQITSQILCKVEMQANYGPFRLFVNTHWVAPALQHDGVIALVAYSQSQAIYYQLSLNLSSTLDVTASRYYDCGMLYPEQPQAKISRIEIAESDLLFILDDRGCITIINRDLANQENGRIFTLNSQDDKIQSFHILTQKEGFLPNPCADLLKFKRDRNLDPSGHLLTISNQSVSLWAMDTNINRKTNAFLRANTFTFSSNSGELFEWQVAKNLVFLILKDGLNDTIRVCILQISLETEANLSFCCFTQVNQFSPTGMGNLSRGMYDLAFLAKDAHHTAKTMEVICIMQDMSTDESVWNLKRYFIKHVNQRELYQRLISEHMIQEPPAKGEELEFEEVRPRNRDHKQAIKETGYDMDAFTQIDKQAQGQIFITAQKGITLQQNKNLLKLLEVNGIQDIPKPAKFVEEPPLFTEKQLKNLAKLCTSMGTQSKRLSDNFEECSKHLKKRVQTLKQTQPLVKSRVQQGVKVVPRIIDEVTSAVVQTSLVKPSVYMKNREQKAVGDMCLGVFAEVIMDERRRLEKDNEGKEQERLMEEKLIKKEHKSFEALKGNLRETCAELFGTHLAQAIKQTIEEAGSAFVRAPFGKIAKDCSQENDRIKCQQEQRIQNLAAKIEGLQIGGEGTQQ